jgi:hypothetical protein
MSEVATLNPKPEPTPVERLTDLATRIKTLHGQVLDAGKTAVVRAMDAGTALIEAKRHVGHGKWLRWLKENCAVSGRTAEDYMLLARHKSEVNAIIAAAANMTLTEVVRKIKHKPGSTKSEDGNLGKYEKAHATLIKNLRGLSPEDVEDAACRTIAALQEVAAELKGLVKAAA